MTVKEKFAQTIREARGEMTLEQFSEKINFGISTISGWENSTRVPVDESINHLSEILGWNDEKRVSFMKVPEGIGDKQKAFVRKTQVLKVTRKQVAGALGYAESTINLWVNGKKFGDELSEKIDFFIDMTVEEARKLFEEKENAKLPLKRKRTPIDYKTIYRLEEKYRRLSHVPDDDPELLKLQRYMNSEW